MEKISSATVNKKTWIALIAILLIWKLSIMPYDSGFTYHLPVILKHSINFSLLIAVALLGYWVWYKLPAKWLSMLWIWLYMIVISILALTGIVDVVYKISLKSLREFIFGIRMFFVSPAPFIILLLLQYWSSKIIPGKSAKR